MPEAIVTKQDATPQDASPILAIGTTHEDVQLSPASQVLTTVEESVTMHGTSPILTHSVLVEALRGFKRYIGYVAAHTAHVMGFASDAEFEQMAEPFSIVPGNAPDDLSMRIAVIQRETGIDFEPEELSELLSVTMDEIDAALSTGPSADAS